MKQEQTTRRPRYADYRTAVLDGWTGTAREQCAQFGITPQTAKRWRSRYTAEALDSDGVLMPLVWRRTPEGMVHYPAQSRFELGRMCWHIARTDLGILQQTINKIDCIQGPSEELAEMRAETVQKRDEVLRVLTRLETAYPELSPLIKAGAPR